MKNALLGAATLAFEGELSGITDFSLAHGALRIELGNLVPHAFAFSRAATS